MEDDNGINLKYWGRLTDEQRSKVWWIVNAMARESFSTRQLWTIERIVGLYHDKDARKEIDDFAARLFERHAGEAK